MPKNGTMNGYTPSGKPLDYNSFEIYVRQALSTPLLTPEQEKELYRKMQRGDSVAREQMICANLRLVVTMAKETMRKYEVDHIPIMDIISAGNIGLIRAIDKFDPARGKLSTYASWWIQRHISELIRKEYSAIVIPADTKMRVSQLKRAEHTLHQQLQRNPTEEEILAFLGWKPKSFARIHRSKISLIPLSTPLYESGEHTIADVIPDETATPDRSHELASSLEMLWSNMHKLPERMRKILELRFGLNDGKEEALAEIGARFGISDERVRQLENLALCTLRGHMTGHFNSCHAKKSRETDPSLGRGRVTWRRAVKQKERQPPF